MAIGDNVNSNSENINTDNYPPRDSEAIVTQDTEAFIKRAEEAAAKLEAANKRQEELLKRQENLEAKRVLSGKSEAGLAPPPQMSEQERIERDANLRFKQLSPFWKKYN